MLLQLNPPIPLKTPKGDGLAWLVLDYGAEHNIMWTVAIDDTGEIWTFSNHEVRAQKNITMGRALTPEIKKELMKQSTIQTQYDSSSLKAPTIQKFIPRCTKCGVQVPCEGMTCGTCLQLRPNLC